jgi:hypothetical protein
MANDDCPGLTVVCTPPSGSTLLLGLTNVICTATDASGNSNQCSFTVTVVEGDSSPAVLSIVRQGDEVVICWPLACLRVLQETTDLNPPIRWSPVSAPVSVSGDKNCVTLPIDGANRFFSLSGN